MIIEILTMKTQATPKTATPKATSARGKKTPAQKPLVKSGNDEAQPTEKGTTNSSHLAEEIKARAYQIWQQQGCPEGLEEQHWRQAEREISRDGSCASLPSV